MSYQSPLCPLPLDFLTPSPSSLIDKLWPKETLPFFFILTYQFILRSVLKWISMRHHPKFVSFIPPQRSILPPSLDFIATLIFCLYTRFTNVWGRPCVKSWFNFIIRFRIRMALPKLGYLKWHQKIFIPTIDTKGGRGLGILT